MHHVNSEDTNNTKTFPSIATFKLVLRNEFSYLKDPRNLKFGHCSICVKHDQRGFFHLSI